MMNPYISDLDYDSARERYNDRLREAQHYNLVRKAQGAEKPAAQPARSSSLLARLRDALLTRRPVRA
ncbi:MAG TPA: hypothetical protein VFU22_26690 [Roseiflexaceae bacterium]|nr:hypothetical protein [Roseiflexaceae bacterium]